MQFPKPSIVEQLAAKGLLENALDLVASRLAEDINNGNLDYAEKFTQDYIRQASSDPRISASAQLRKAVYILTFEYNVLVNPSMEIVWDIVMVYGLLNSGKVTEFLKHLPPIYKPKFHKFLLHLAQQPAIQDLDKALSLVFTTQFSEIITPELVRTIKGMKTDNARIIVCVAKSHMASASAQTLLSLFPDLKITRANELLESASLEEVTQKLLDDPSQITGRSKSKPKYILLDKAEKNGPNTKQRTLQMALEYLDEDPDDDMDMAQESLSAADRRLLEQDKMLYDAFTRDPKLFDKESRKTKNREQLKKKFDWTDEQLEGWAVMVQRDPKRKAKLAWDADFGIKASPTPEPQAQTGESKTKPEATEKLKRKPPPKAKYKQHHKDKPLKE